MKSRLRAAFVVTVSTLGVAACHEKNPYDEVHWNPPPRDLEAAPDAGAPERVVPSNPPSPPQPEPVGPHLPTEPFHTINPPGVLPNHPGPATPDAGN